MVNLKILGVGTAEHQFLHQSLDEWLEENAVDHEIEDILDVQQFIEHGVRSIPAIVINGKVKFQKNDYPDLKSFASAVKCYIDQFKSLFMKKIIVPTDFSDTASNAFQYGKWLAGYFKCTVEAVHVFYPATDINNGYFLNPELENKRKGQLEKFVSAPARTVAGESDSAGIEVRSQFILGFPIEELIAISKEPDTGFIVVGSTGESGLMGKLFGSISSEVARRAHCPVMLVPSGVPFDVFKNILYATNDPGMDAIMAPFVERFAATFGSRLHCIHVDRGSNDYPDWEISRMFEHNKHQVDVVGTSITASDIIEGLNNYVEKHHIDLIIMSTKRRNFWEVIIHKSMTKRMALTTKVPLLVFHYEDKI